MYAWLPYRYFYAMTFNRMGTVPLPLALHLASYTVLGLFCFFAGSLNLIDPVKIPHGLMFLAVCVFSWGYVFGILMARKEVVILGFLASAAWLIAATVGAARFGFDWRLTALLVARSEEHTSELQSRLHLVCRLLLEKKKNNTQTINTRSPTRYK